MRSFSQFRKSSIISTNSQSVNSEHGNDTGDDQHFTGEVEGTVGTFFGFPSDDSVGEHGVSVEESHAELEEGEGFYSLGSCVASGCEGSSEGIAGCSECERHFFKKKIKFDL